MGKNIVDDYMSLNIEINGNQAKKELYELENNVKDWNSENEKLERTLKKCEQQIAANDKTIDKYTKTLEKEAAKQKKQEAVYASAMDKLSELDNIYKQLDGDARNSSFGQKLQQELIEVDRAARESAKTGLNSIQAQEALRKSISKLSTENEKLSLKTKESTSKLDSNKASVADANAKIKTMHNTLDITTLSIDELNREITHTNNLFRALNPNDPKWKEHQQTLVKLRVQHQKLSAQAQKTKGTLCKMADGVNKYWNFVVSGLATFTGVVFGVKQAINKFVDFTDVLADVRKTTGLTEQGVAELNEELKKIDTRSSQEELMGLARIGGKLGIEGKENLEGFVRAADQINIALKEDLGGDSEEAIRQVGKLVDIFKVKEEFGIEKGMLKVGSVINELGAASTANEGFIVEFSKRVAGVAPSAGVSVSAVMGLAATLDQFGQQSEASATVYSQMMSKMFKNTADFANIAGMKLSDFSEMMKTDANEAFIRVLEGLKGNNGGMETLVRNLGEMDLQGVRASTVLGSLANNTQILRAQQELANKSFNEGISLTNESNVKNTNLAAQRDKAKKQLDERIKQLGEKLHPAMMLCTSSMSLMIKTLGILVDFFGKYGGVILSISSLLVMYAAAVKVNVLWNNKLKDAITSKIIADKLDIFWTKAKTASIFLLAAAKAALTGNINKAAAAMKVFFNITKLNPLGLLLTAITSVGIGIYKFCTHMSDAEKAIKKVTDASLEFEKQAALEKSTLQQLFYTLLNSKEGTIEWANARKTITEKYGQYLSDLGLEITTLKEAKVAYAELSVAIHDTMLEKAKESSRADAEKGRIDSQITQLREMRNAINDTYKDSPIKAERYFKMLKAELEKGGKMSANMTTLMFNAGIEDNIATYVEATKTYKATMSEIDSIYGSLSGSVSVSAPAPKGQGGEVDGKATLKNDGSATSKYDSNSQAPQSTFELQITSLKEQYAKKMMLKEEYETKLDGLELAHLHWRLANEENSEDERLKIRSQIAEKQIAINDKNNKETVDKEKEYVDALIAESDTLLRKEDIAYTARLQKAGLYNKEKSKMSERELQALEILYAEHQENINKINADAVKKRMDAYGNEVNTKIKNMQTANDMELTILQTKHLNELNNENLSAQERKALKKKHAKEETELAEAQALEMIDALNQIFVDMEIEEFGLGEMVMPEDQKQEFENQIAELKKKLAELKGEELKNPEAMSGPGGVDVLGMTPETWEQFIDNIKSGTFGIGEMCAAVGVLQEAWAAYDKFKTASEKKELKQYERGTKKKKTALDKQLDAGTISQEQYNARTAQLDAELDAKKEQMEKKQAKRQKAQAIFQTIINTAVAVTSALKASPPWLGIALAATIGALGAVQIATIAATQYAKGKYPVVGNDDKKTYQADYTGDNLHTGIYNEPTLGLFSEKEPEMVVDGATTRKLVFDYPNVYNAIMDVSKGRTPQFADGRYPVMATSTSSDSIAVAQSVDPEIKQLIRQNTEAMSDLKNLRLEFPWYGRGGFDEKMNKAKKYENSINRK